MIFWYYHAVILISVDQQFPIIFLRYMAFFKYFFIVLIFNCLWIILLWIFWNFCDFISNFVINQITSCFFSFLNYSSESSFKSICCRFLSMIKKFLTLFYHSFTNIFTQAFRKRRKYIAFYKQLICKLHWIAHYFLYFTF